MMLRVHPDTEAVLSEPLSNTNRVTRLNKKTKIVIDYKPKLCRKLIMASTTVYAKSTCYK